MTGKTISFEEEAAGHSNETLMYPVIESAGIIEGRAIQSHDPGPGKKPAYVLPGVGIVCTGHNRELFPILNDPIRNFLRAVLFFPDRGRSDFHGHSVQLLRPIEMAPVIPAEDWPESIKVRSPLLRLFPQHILVGIEIIRQLMAPSAVPGPYREV